MPNMSAIKMSANFFGIVHLHHLHPLFYVYLVFIVNIDEYEYTYLYIYHLSLNLYTTYLTYHLTHHQIFVSNQCALYIYCISVVLT